MSKDKDPAFLFYPADFMVGTRLFSFIQKGKYIELLCLQHQQGHLSKDDIDDFCGGHDPKIFAKFTKDDNGLYYNERLEKEMAKRASYTTSQSEKGTKGALSRWHSHSTAIAQPMSNQCPSENENINRNINISFSNDRDANIGECSKSPQMTKKCTSNEVLFDRFWEAYPKKKAKVEARKRWDKLKVTDALAQTMLDAIAEQKKSADWTREDGRFIPYPATWLNQGRWLDELSASEPNTAVPPRFSDFDQNEAMRRALERSYGDE